jgi:hypothetical protein
LYLIRGSCEGEEKKLNNTKDSMDTKVHKGFYGKIDGGIRLTLKIAPILPETVSLWSEKIESVIQQVKAIILDGASLD